MDCALPAAAVSMPDTPKHRRKYHLHMQQLGCPFPMMKLGDHFIRRWKIELYVEDIKTSQAKDALRTKSPDLICR
ncbi:MAG: hypothetical protein ACI8XO_001398 [Verrucomicrobiales bacterium]